ncbi:MAG: U32 family peptidase [Deltaproteobacteria bacterium]|jgi:collagenase-like PrtC family protease|nr:U32 family peptidase [Deltaproteobacteria bacterium]
MIKILSPVSRCDEVEDVIAAGADELYCGILLDDWIKGYTVSASLNRRQEDNTILGTSPHFKSFEELKESVEIAHSRSVPVILTLNEHYYSKDQYPYLLSYVDKVLEAGIDAFIIGDVAFILSLRERGISTDIHISTAGTAFNSETVRFYQELGASRVILPRHLTIEEIESIASEVSDVELEAFILNSRCANIDGFCTFQHGLADLFPDEKVKEQYLNACMLSYKISVYPDAKVESDSDIKEKISWERQSIWSALHIDDRPCGACALFEFSKIGLHGVKIVGRQNAKSKKIKDVIFLRTLIDSLSEKNPSKEEFRKFSRRLYQETYEWPCLIFKCYYPSVLLS